MAKRLSNGINVDKLDTVTKELGVRVRVWNSTLCPNMKSLESMDHDINCTICNNNMIDFNCRETIALIQQQDLNEQFKVQGTFHIDEVIMTFLAGQTIMPYSKIQLLDFVEDFYELVQRQEGTDVDVLKYKACSVLGVFTVQNNIQKEYHFGTDFTLDKNGSIKWISANRPSDRQIYSVYYKYNPIYRAIKAIHRDRYSQYNLRPGDIKAPKKTIDGNTYVKLPETWIIKRDYLLERRDEDKELLDKNEYYDPNS